PAQRPRSRARLRSRPSSDPRPSSFPVFSSPNIGTGRVRRRVEQERRSLPIVSPMQTGDGREELPDGAASVLIVDDNADSLRALEALLEPLGARIVTAGS